MRGGRFGERVAAECVWVAQVAGDAGGDEDLRAGLREVAGFVAGVEEGEEGEGREGYCCGVGCEARCSRMQTFSQKTP